MKTYYIISYFFFFALISIEAKGEEPLRHHVIIAVDKAGCDDWIGKNEVGHEVRRLLLNTPFEDKSGRKHLYETGDYVSFVGFRLNLSQTDMNVFAMPLHDKSGSLAWKAMSTKRIKSLFGFDWDTIVLQPYNSGNDGFSLVSVAKAYALAALKSEEPRVGRTFLVMITDHHYNGNNFYDEMKAFEENQVGTHDKKKIAQLRKPRRLTTQDIFKKCYEVEQYYLCRYLSTTKLSSIGYVEFYEYVPLQRNFTLSTAINYPTHLKAKRKRDGDYKVVIPLSWRGVSHYTFNRMEVFPNYKGISTYKTPIGAVVLDTLQNNSLTFDIPSDKSAKCLQLRVWLGLVDGFYNATLMSPERESPIELGRDGLNVLIPIEYDADATIYGSTWAGKVGWKLLPWIDDQYAAAHLWQFYILPFLILILLIFIGYRLAKSEYYNPKANEFTIG